MYFQHKVKLIAEGKTDENEPSAGPDLAQDGTQDGAGASHIADLVNKIVLKDEPPKPEFMTDAPSLEALDLDIVKLTAQFVRRALLL